METSNSLATKLGRCRRTIITISTNGEITVELKKYGYTDEKLAHGTLLLVLVENHFEKQKKESAEGYAASQVYLGKKVEADALYRKDMKLLRIAGKSSVELAKLLPSEVTTGNSKEFYKTTSVMYQNLVNNPAHSAALATVGLKSESFTERITRIKELEALYIVREKEMAEANVATINRDKEFDELLEYCKDMRTIAKIALENKPALKKMVDEL